MTQLPPIEICLIPSIADTKKLAEIGKTHGINIKITNDDSVIICYDEKKHSIIEKADGIDFYSQDKTGDVKLVKNFYSLDVLVDGNLVVKIEKHYE